MEESKQTKSMKRKPSADDTFIQVAFCADFIRRTGLALKMTHSSITFSQVLLHRYYYQVSIDQCSSIWVIASCLLLSCKVNDITQGQSIHNISNVLHYHLHLSSEPSKLLLNYYGAEGYAWKKNIIETEKQILFRLGFHLSTGISIHSYILIFVNALMQHSDAHATFDKANVLQGAWNYANDCMLYNEMVAVEKTESIACCCIQLALKGFGGVPEGWHVVFDSSAAECERMMEKVGELNGKLKRLCLNGCLSGVFVDYSNDPTFVRFHAEEKEEESIKRKQGDIDSSINKNNKKKRRRFADAQKDEK